MAHIKALQISKLDAARRQLETAIRLYFHDLDAVSIHTLTAASHTILHDLTASRGADRMLVKDQLLDFVQPDQVALIKSKLNEAENFFKHADRDSTEMLEFNPDLSELFLIDACAQYHRLTGESPALMRVFQMWYMLHHPNVFTALSMQQLDALRKATKNLNGLSKLEYFQLSLPLLLTHGI